MELTVYSPLSGNTVTLKEVPDVVFSSGIIGPGMAIKPEKQQNLEKPEKNHNRWSLAAAPVSGIVTKVFSHAYMVTALPEIVDPSGLEITEIIEQGTSVLVHLGLDTVKMQGRGFKIIRQAGESVEVGDTIVEWQPSLVEASGYNPLCPVVIVDSVHAEVKELVDNHQTVAIKQALFETSG